MANVAPAWDENPGAISGQYSFHGGGGDKGQESTTFVGPPSFLPRNGYHGVDLLRPDNAVRVTRDAERASAEQAREASSHQ